MNTPDYTLSTLASLAILSLLSSCAGSNGSSSINSKMLPVSRQELLPKSPDFTNFDARTHTVDIKAPSTDLNHVTSLKRYIGKRVAITGRMQMGKFGPVICGSHGTIYIMESARRSASIKGSIWKGLNRNVKVRGTLFWTPASANRNEFTTGVPELYFMTVADVVVEFAKS